MILIVGLLLQLLLWTTDVLDVSADVTDDVDKLRFNGDWNGILPWQINKNNVNGTHKK